ncbi:MAG: hypothetical protein NZ455_03860 [Bacteroidia bacterium]|nr:hypothetical protein [Bacteroidia bacterium]MDW8347795.1 hypothetical protein [Bacteroidia bacterium]
MSSAERSEAPKRSVARSTPTRAQRGTRPKTKYKNYIMSQLNLTLLTFIFFIFVKSINFANQYVHKEIFLIHFFSTLFHSRSSFILSSPFRRYMGYTIH